MWTADNYLAHHGIKGQKWGVRRFQNENGTFTSLGRQRHADAVADYKSAKEKKRAAKKAYRAGNISKEEYIKSRQEAGNARKNVKSTKADIAAYKLADKGKRLADKGESINKLNKQEKSGNNKAMAVMGTAAGVAVASNFLAASGRMSMKSFVGVSAAAATGMAIASSANRKGHNKRSIKMEALKAYEAAQKGNVSGVTKSIQQKKVERNIAVGAAVAKHVISNRETYSRAASSAAKAVKIGMEMKKRTKNRGNGNRIGMRIVDGTARVMS